MENSVFLPIALFFLIGAIFILLGGIFVKNRETIRGIWLLFFIETLIVGFVVVPAYFGNLPFLLAVALIGTKSQHEILQQVLPDCPICFKRVACAVCPLVCAAALFINEMFMYRVQLAVVVMLLLMDIGTKARPGRIAELAKIAFISVYPCVFIAYLLLLRKLNNGFILIVFLYGVSEINDAFALVSGKLFGRKKMFPRLSPGKTYAGMSGGIAAACLFGLLFHRFVGAFSFTFIVSGTCFVILTTVLGDLVTSKIKRNLNIKDFGVFLPKHGGVLDTYDSLIFSAPLFYWFATRFL
ncbi:phosphatidate cytidylyltransferase [Thermodesulfobacteriota bacterium]